MTILNHQPSCLREGVFEKKRNHNFKKWLP